MYVEHPSQCASASSTQKSRRSLMTLSEMRMFDSSSKISVLLRSFLYQAVFDTSFTNATSVRRPAIGAGGVGAFQRAAGAVGVGALHSATALPAATSLGQRSSREL